MGYHADDGIYNVQKWISSLWLQHWNSPNISLGIVLYISIYSKSKPKNLDHVKRAFRTYSSPTVSGALLFSVPRAHAAFQSWCPRVSILALWLPVNLTSPASILIANMSWKSLFFKTTKKYLGTERAFPLVSYTVCHSPNNFFDTMPYLHSFPNLQFRFMLSLAYLPAMIPDWAPILQSSLYTAISLIMFPWQPTCTRLSLQCNIKNASLLRTNKILQHHTYS